MKVLITENTQINHGDDRGGVHADAGEIVEINKDQAQKLVSVGRALYTDKKDDPRKGALDTASAAMLKAAAEVRAAKNAPKAPANGATEGAPAGSSQGASTGSA